MKGQPWTKACSCGLSHTETQWEALALVGFQHDATCCELRKCHCGSTLAVTCEHEEDPDWDPDPDYWQDEPGTGTFAEERKWRLDRAYRDGGR